MPEFAVPIPQEAVEAFCRKWQVVEFALFGSVLRPDFDSDSDIDVMVCFAHTARWNLFDWVDMKADLEAIFGRSVDLVTRKAVEHSRNPYRQKAILESVRVIHAA